MLHFIRRAGKKREEHLEFHLSFSVKSTSGFPSELQCLQCARRLGAIVVGSRYALSHGPELRERALRELQNRAAMSELFS